MRKYIKYIVISVIFIICLSPLTTSFATNESQYYIIFHNSEDGAMSMEVGRNEIIYNDALSHIDLNNLEIPSNDVKVHYSFFMDSYDPEKLNEEIRYYLLSFGYAKLIDTSIASESEIECQKEAQKNNWGLWINYNETGSTAEDIGASADASDENTFGVFWLNIKGLFQDYIGEIVSLLVSCGFLTFLIRKIFKTQRKHVFFGGANASGKTTMCMLLLNPEASRDDLISQDPSLKKNKHRIIRDDANEKITLEASLIDPPGHELHHIIDELSASNVAYKKRIVVLVVSPTKSNYLRNEPDIGYINDQLQTINILWSAVLKSKAIIKPETFVLFINKIDLFDDNNRVKDLFVDHKRALEKICKESKIPFECIAGSVIDKTGMTHFMKVLKKRK